MEDQEKIDQYDIVEIIHVPESYEGIINIGDVGVVVEKYDDENFEVECVQPGGSCKWLGTLTIRDIRLKSKDPFSHWVEKSLTDRSITKPSIVLGILIGATFGVLCGGGLGALTKSLNGILIGALIGLIPGVVTGALTAALTVKTAGTTGGIGVGYFTGMIFGGVFGMLIGLLMPSSLLESVHTEAMPMFHVFMMGRFEMAMSISFLLSILATIVGVWISGRNLAPRNLKERYRP